MYFSVFVSSANRARSLWTEALLASNILTAANKA